MKIFIFYISGIFLSLLLTSCILIDGPTMRIKSYDLIDYDSSTDSLKVGIFGCERIGFDWRKKILFSVIQFCSTADSVPLHHDSISVLVNNKEFKVGPLYDYNMKQSDSFPFNHPDGISISFGGRIKEGDSITIIEKGVPEPSKQFTIQFIVPIDTITKKKKD
ncbi:MAG: hypothetical protein IKR25_05825 [Muribaculaceae bacterium]|nr:hypothetical protein [Muribaculaceae bacterium]